MAGMKKGQQVPPNGPLVKNGKVTEKRVTSKDNIKSSGPLPFKPSRTGGGTKPKAKPAMTRRRGR